MDVLGGPIFFKASLYKRGYSPASVDLTRAASTCSFCSLELAAFFPLPAAAVAPFFDEEKPREALGAVAALEVEERDLGGIDVVEVERGEEKG